MQLTRRDALMALSGVGISTYGIGQITHNGGEPKEVTTLLAVADLLYPSQVAVEAEFISTYVLGKAAGRPEYETHLREAVSELNQQSRQLFNHSFHALSAARRRRVLRRIGVDTVRANPDGKLAQRIRYYVVKELLYALYSTPVGGRLLDKENPPGHPGGRDAYQRGPGGEQ